jgi:hypothetical protein
VWRRDINVLHITNQPGVLGHRKHTARQPHHNSLTPNSGAGCGAHLDIPAGVKAIQLVDDLQHRPLHLVVPPSTVVKAGTTCTSRHVTHLTSAQHSTGNQATRPAMYWSDHVLYVPDRVLVIHCAVLY